MMHHEPELTSWQMDMLGSPERNLMRRFVIPTPADDVRPLFRMSHAIAATTAFFKGQLNECEIRALYNLTEIVGLRGLIRAVLDYPYAAPKPAEPSGNDRLPRKVSLVRHGKD